MCLLRNSGSVRKFVTHRFKLYSVIPNNEVYCKLIPQYLINIGTLYANIALFDYGEITK